MGAGMQQPSPLVSEIYDIFDEIEQTVGARVLSRKWEILTELSLAPGIRPQQFRCGNSMSSAAFFNLLADLEAGGLVMSQVDPADRRGRIYSLTPTARNGLLVTNVHVHQWMELRPGGKEELAGCMPTLAWQSRKIFGIPYFSTGYRIIIFLYDCGPLKTSDLLRMSDLSSSTFFKVLRKLSDRKIIAGRSDPSDGRVLHYSLDEDIHGFISEQLARARQCLERWPGQHHVGMTKAAA